MAAQTQTQLASSPFGTVNLLRTTILLCLGSDPKKIAPTALVVVPYSPPQATPYEQVKHFLDSYREHRAGTIQLLLVLWCRS
jgi:hypothetical protein